jgi:hypothetical protein
LNPALDVSQYAHTSWKVREGFSKGYINSIAQTADGYLWLGTEFGLYRFDGVRNVPWQPPAKQPLPSTTIMSLLATRDGTLWTGTLKGLASWKGGRLTQYPELTGLVVDALLEDREGAVWAGAFGTPTGRLCATQGDVHCSGDDGGLGKAVVSLHATEILIVLEYNASFLTLSITDDGRGFDLEEGYRKTGHWGLKNMQERATQIRGKCTITSAPGHGTQVEVRLPLASRSLRNK